MGNFRRRFVLPMKIPVSLAQRRKTFQHTRIMLLFPYLVIKTVNECLFVCQTLNQGTTECMIDTVEVTLGELIF